MKRLLKSLIFSFLVLVLVSAFSSPTPINKGHILSSTPAKKVDTTGLIRSLKVDTFKLSIIPPSSGVQFYKNGIVFLSMSKNEMKMAPKQISFGAVEAYSADVEDSILGKHTVFSPLTSFSYPCEAITFSHDYNSVYFTMIPKKGNKEKIYLAKLAANNLNQTVLVADHNPLEFCSDNASYSHPALSSDDNLMIFASDRVGSVGGMDLYVTRKKGLIWSDPENLGHSINTPGNEFFPFLDSENNLYFSSDRLPGYGGYDIFTCKFNGKGWDKPINLSDKINSDKDDIAFTINKTDGRTAFFTRREKSANFEMQLFRIKIKKEASDPNPLTISDILNGKPVSKTYLAASTQSEIVIPNVSGTIKTKPEEQVESEIVKPKPAKQIVNKPVKTSQGKQVITEQVKTKPEKKVVTNPEPEVKSPENKDARISPVIPATGDQKDVVRYKVQLLPDKSQIKAKKMDIIGISYKIDEYLYRGVVRYTIGDFISLRDATALQTVCRQTEYPQSFVVVFKNNTRALDQNLFK
jgi:hypothetical protein